MEKGNETSEAKFQNKIPNNKANGVLSSSRSKLQDSIPGFSSQCGVLICRQNEFEAAHERRYSSF